SVETSLPFHRQRRGTARATSWGTSAPERRLGGIVRHFCHAGSAGSARACSATRSPPGLAHAEPAMWSHVRARTERYGSRVDRTSTTPRATLRGNHSVSTSGSPVRVIGAGFGRTGTLSLKRALEDLGFGPTYHMQEV